LLRLAEEERARSFWQSCATFTGCGLGFGAGVTLTVVGERFISGDPKFANTPPSQSDIYGGAFMIATGLSFISFTSGLTLVNPRGGPKSAEAAYSVKVKPIDPSTSEGAARREQVARDILRSLAARDRTVRRITGVSSIILGIATSVATFKLMTATTPGNEPRLGPEEPLGLGAFLGPVITVVGAKLLFARSRYEKAYGQYLLDRGRQRE
jgi:hypothetical protein